MKKREINQEMRDQSKNDVKNNDGKKNTSARDTNSKNKGENEDSSWITYGLPLGLCFGVAYGIIFKNLAMGIALGICFGSAFSAIGQKKKTVKDETEEKNKNGGAESNEFLKIDGEHVKTDIAEIKNAENEHITDESKEADKDL